MTRILRLYQISLVIAMRRSLSVLHFSGIIAPQTFTRRNMRAYGHHAIPENESAAHPDGVKASILQLLCCCLAVQRFQLFVGHGSLGVIDDDPLGVQHDGLRHGF